jgi:predicted RNA-binding Zn-ribbon protein involved in translation (DUF1610 family)
MSHEKIECPKHGTMYGYCSECVKEGSVEQPSTPPPQDVDWDEVPSAEESAEIVQEVDMSEGTITEIGGTFNCPVCGLSYIHTHELHRITSSNTPAQIVLDMLESCKSSVRLLADQGGYEYENRCEAKIGQAEKLYGLLTKLRLAASAITPTAEESEKYRPRRLKMTSDTQKAREWLSENFRSCVGLDDPCFTVQEAVLIMDAFAAHVTVQKDAEIENLRSDNAQLQYALGRSEDALCRLKTKTKGN